MNFIRKHRVEVIILTYLVALFGLFGAYATWLDRQFMVTYHVATDEVALVEHINGSWKVYRSDTDAAYSTRNSILYRAKKEGVVVLANDLRVSGVLGSCAQDISFRFMDGVRGALCGEIEYKLPVDDFNIVVLLTSGGDLRADRNIRDALQYAAAMCSAGITAEEAYSERRQYFLGCIKDNMHLQSRMGVEMTKAKFTGVEFSPDVEEMLKRHQPRKV